MSLDRARSSKGSSVAARMAPLSPENSGTSGGQLPLQPPPVVREVVSDPLVVMIELVI